MSLENAPDEVKLAVDLIMLLEENNVPAQTVLAALEIIRRDYENKVKSAEEALQNAPESPALTKTDKCSWKDSHVRRTMPFFVKC